jgi:hypothetical protein
MRGGSVLGQPVQAGHRLVADLQIEAPLEDAVLHRLGDDVHAAPSLR